MRNLFIKLCFLLMSVLLLPVGYAFSMPTSGSDKAEVDWNGSDFLGYNIDILFNGSGDNEIDYIGFCLEKEVGVWHDTTYNISSVEEYATLGGINKDSTATTGQDLLSDATKWVYWEYTFGNHFNATKNSTLALLVQEVIWYLEDEIDKLSTTGLIFYNNYVALADSYDYDTSHYNIKVLNIVLSDGRDVQSMIIGEPVPEPATMLLFATGLIGLAGVAHRRKKK